MRTVTQSTSPMPAGHAVMSQTLGCEAKLLSETTEHLQELCSKELFQGARLLKINHAGSLYTLRITRLGKLILTK